ncbi:LysE family transporter [Amycolatopsis pigmentata]|uniref:LysE family transporter n=1 Tax=Amycolatopsis pigmentata TaxID=450801 RepID=A0ABW5FNZ3_9PSEU
MTILAVVGVYLVVVMIPGPIFVFVVHTASTTSRRAAFAAAVGITAGTVVLATAAVLDARGILGHSTVLDRLLRIVCGLYLGYLGIKLWKSTRKPADVATDELTMPSRRFFWRGVVATVTNPKALLLLGGLFATLVPGGVSLGFRGVIVVAIAVATLCWHAALAMTFSTGLIQRAYGRMQTKLDIIAGTLFVGLGTGIALS